MKNKVNISIDDVSPHPKSSIKVIDRCFELIEKFPDVKFTLFVSMSYGLIDGPSYSILDYPDFCDALKSLSSNNFEIGWHGYNHGIPKISNGDEFRYLSYTDAMSKFKKMFEDAEKAGIKSIIKPIFRPPAFYLSPSSFDACRDCGIKVIALSPKPVKTVEYQGKNNEFERVVYYNVNPPDKPLKLYEKTEMIYHACEWDRSYLSPKMSINLEKFLEDNLSEIEFVFLEDL